MSRIRDKVFCLGCANLFMLRGTHPQCVASAEFVEGPLRKRIDVVGMIPAEQRNAYNNCGYRTSVSLKAWAVKRWVLWRLNDGKKEDKINEKRLRDYSVAEEGRRAKFYRESGEGTEEQEDADDLLTDGGTDGDEESKPPDSVGEGDLLDPRDDHG